MTVVVGYAYGLARSAPAPLVPGGAGAGRLAPPPAWQPSPSAQAASASASDNSLKGPGENVPDLENGRILELLLSRWAFMEGSEANLTQLVVPVMLSSGPFMAWDGQ